jgi:hypothetical protein
MNIPASSKKTRLRYSVIITTILTIGMILSFIKYPVTLAISLGLFILGHLIAIIYALSSRIIQRIEKIVILLISSFPLVYYVFILNHWPGIYIIWILQWISVAAFMFASFRMINRLKYEFPFLGLMAVYILLNIL